MRNLRELDKYRITHPARLQWFDGWAGDETCGVFEVRSERGGHLMRVMASSSDGWDHLSVSLEKRPPTWYEMEQVKRLFFKPDEVAIQLHVPPSQHINIYPNCLHLWRDQKRGLVLPPSWMVGPSINREKPSYATDQGSKESAAHTGADGRAEAEEGAAPGAQGGGQGAG